MIDLVDKYGEGLFYKVIASDPIDDLRSVVEREMGEVTVRVPIYIRDTFYDRALELLKELGRENYYELIPITPKFSDGNTDD